MQEGKSKHWEKILNEMTGTGKLNASSLKSYFKPLIDWLISKNKELGNKIGWD